MACSHNLHSKRHSSMDSAHVVPFLCAHEEDHNITHKVSNPLAIASTHKHSSTSAVPPNFLIIAQEVDIPNKPASPRHCLCSPTTHEGSFRCRLHRSSQAKWPKVAASPKMSSDPLTTSHEWAEPLLPQALPKCSAKIPPRPPIFSTSASKSIEAQ